jgi:hypothetical protein
MFNLEVLFFCSLNIITVWCIQRLGFCKQVVEAAMSQPMMDLLVKGC